MISLHEKPALQTWNPEPGTRNLEPGTRNPERHPDEYQDWNTYKVG
jgi:hypothetical protein